MIFQSSSPIVFSIFRVLTVDLINKCYWNIVKKTTVSHTVEMFKQMFLDTGLLTRILSIIILIVILYLKLSVVSQHTFFYNTYRTKLYVSPVTLLVDVFVSDTITHTSHFFLPHLVDPTSLSNVYNLALTR